MAGHGRFGSAFQRAATKEERAISPSLLWSLNNDIVSDSVDLFEKYASLSSPSRRVERLERVCNTLVVAYAYLFPSWCIRDAMLLCKCPLILMTLFLSTHL
jgi:hypothetical protein